MLHQINKGISEGKNIDTARNSLSKMCAILGFKLDFKSSKINDLSFAKIQKAFEYLENNLKINVQKYLDVNSQNSIYTLENIIKIRKNLRSDKKFEASDYIRDILNENGIKTEDESNKQ